MHLIRSIINYIEEIALLYCKIHTFNEYCLAQILLCIYRYLTEFYGIKEIKCCEISYKCEKFFL